NGEVRGGRVGPKKELQGKKKSGRSHRTARSKQSLLSRDLKDQIPGQWFTEAERSRPAGPWGRGRLRTRPLGRRSATCSHPPGSRRSGRKRPLRSGAG